MDDITPNVDSPAEFRFIASVHGKSQECETREEARAWVAREREVSGNYEGASRIEMVEV